MAADPVCSIWTTPRIWFDEVERIGMQRCTPVGYMINKRAYSFSDWQATEGRRIG
jgi:hypothetical protein